MQSEKGTVTLDDFHQTPTLQTKLNELLNEKRITFEQSVDTSLNHSEKQEDEGKLDKMITTLDSLTKHISALTKVVEANTIQVAHTLHSSMGAITEAVVGKLESSPCYELSLLS